jgi:hypothetical protein
MVVGQALTFEALKAKQRELRSGFPTNLGLRVHRALSWLQRAEMSGDDQDARFIFLWVAFNAAYAEDRGDADLASERSSFTDYFERVIALDSGQRIYDAIWRRFSGPIRVLLDNKYVYQPFWSHHNQVPGFDDWEERFTKSRRKLKKAVGEHDTKVILTTLFDRLYVLRNQLIHGGATWNSSVNRAQVTDGAAIMGFLLPLFADIMMDNPGEPWGAPYYPVID